MRRGKTPVLTEEQARRLLERIDSSSLVGAGRGWGKRWWVRLHEKRGKRHEMPADLELEAFIDEYFAAAGIREDGRGPLFCSAISKAGVLAEKPMKRGRRLPQGPPVLCRGRLQGQARCHVFRATGITAYLCPAAPSKTQA
jgi:hypothetical protein